MAKARRRRRRLSLTSLIDVIFLLLLFFMLTSTFTRFSEVELAAGAGGAGESALRPVFMQLAPDELRVNGEIVALDEIGQAQLLRAAERGTPLLVSLLPNVDAQRLTDLLVALRALPDLRVTVLED
tara:strand:- start:88059 stop:88436 length:378 start_codon:yes stop_codon:yes gene_type:complete